MKICERGLNFFQVSNDNGMVRICTWTHDAVIGNLVDQTFEEVWYGDKARKLRKRLCDANYKLCVMDDCPFLSQNTIEEHRVEIDSVPDYPECISLSYDNICNYNCSTCDIHERYMAADKTEMGKRFDKIESEIRKILPHVKEISANGQGEVFASKRTMKMLSEWKPIAPASECRVGLETNGSLFDEEHWKQIDNLGKYYLMVSVTVMSFDEYTYQQLSGVKYPIERIENNLRFIKSLREKGIINYLELATVVQERNFRQLPEFTRRCIEEFGADEVRLRYFLPWHKKAPEVEWFADVRNPYHPYYEEYREIMKDPIFKHPKVNDWSGGRDSLLGQHPFWNFKKELERREYINKTKINMMERYISEPQNVKEQISNRIPKGSRIIIYGIGEIGRLVTNIMKSDYEIVCIMDRNCKNSSYEEIDILDPEKIVQRIQTDYVVITPIGDTKNIKEGLCGAIEVNDDNIVDVEMLLGEKTNCLF